MTPMIEIHAISVLPKSHCSQHRHQFKWNGFYVLSGELDVLVQKNDYDLIDRTRLSAGEFTTVTPGELHWFESGDTAVEALEIYYIEPIDGHDIVRESVGGRDDRVLNVVNVVHSKRNGGE